VIRIYPALSALSAHQSSSTQTYTLSLPDALPISTRRMSTWHPPASPPASTWSCPTSASGSSSWRTSRLGRTAGCRSSATLSPSRSEEHTSELQSRENLVCRLLLEKKKSYHLRL